MLGEISRKSAFWVLDACKGGNVRRHYQDIEKQLNDMAYCKQQVNKNMRKLLHFAVNEVEAYKPYQGYKKLSDFPVINKNIIKENYEAFQSDLCRTGNTISLHTSGSTGTPFAIIQDRNKRDRVNAEMMYFWKKAGYEIGMKYVFFRIWTETNQKSRLTAFARNLVMEDVLRLDESNLERIRKRLKQDKKIRMLLGYASTFENLASYLLKCGDTPDMFHIRCVISGAEALMESTREKLVKVFGCTVVSLYSNQENGMLAQECACHREFHWNSSSFYLELLKLNSDEKAEPGELGRVVITDLFNYATPMIRYDTGDLAVRKQTSDCGWNTICLERIEGRKADITYTAEGEPISPSTWGVLFWEFPDIKQYQIIQESRTEYVIRMNVEKDRYDEAKLYTLVKNVVGDVKIQFEYVDEIPVLSSGKFKRSICKIQQ